MAQPTSEGARSMVPPDRVLPQGIANRVLFLAAGDSRMSTTQEHLVDGGWY
jgi:NAD(P)-dependent dehydrogenase (short-subunit alcohol dehydrogenase family)